MALLAALTAGSGSIAGTAARPTRIVFIGNSLTQHPPSTELRWPHNWGMAASAEGRDYAHQTGTALGLPVSAFNMSGLENEPDVNLSRIPEITSHIDARTLVVVELGDNVQAVSLDKFDAAYSRLLASAKGLRLICLSTWWRNASVDAVIRQHCASQGGRYIYIGDLHADPANRDNVGPQFSNPGVNAHPHDWSMTQIAVRIVAAVHK